MTHARKYDSIRYRKPILKYAVLKKSLLTNFVTRYPIILEL